MDRGFSFDLPSGTKQQTSMHTICEWMDESSKNILRAGSRVLLEKLTVAQLVKPLSWILWN
jgi:hypothetical protein